MRMNMTDKLNKEAIIVFNKFREILYEENISRSERDYAHVCSKAIINLCAVFIISLQLPFETSIQSADSISEDIKKVLKKSKEH
jgi:hypothetical protein